MDFLTKIWNYIKCKITGEKQTQPVQKSPSAKQPIFNTKKNTPNPNEIPIIRDITDEIGRAHV